MVSLLPRGDKENYVYLVKAIIPLSTPVLNNTIVQSCQAQKALTWFKDERQMVMSRECGKLKRGIYTREVVVSLKPHKKETKTRENVEKVM